MNPFKTFKLGPDGLIPAIIVDAATKTVLMMAYMNEEAYNQTLSTGRMTYFSRSRQCLWEKGLTSGHTQRMISMAIDCDRDTLLFEVQQNGPACHTGTPSCFFDALYEPLPTVIEALEKTLAMRRASPAEGSYTSYLFDKGLDKILKKIGEESTEIVIAAKNSDTDELLNESADFLYHLLVLLNLKELSFSDVLAVLESRKR